MFIEIPDGTRSRAGLAWFIGLAACSFLTACSTLFHHEQVTYEEGGIRVGIETDLSTQRASPPATNAHPAKLTAVQVRHLLGMIEVSGYTGTIVGAFITPPRRPVFNEEEIDALAEPVAAALRNSGKEDRVFFSIANPTAKYERDRLEGALFLRGPFLHFVLTDHYAYLRADTAGGDDYKDPRDMKGMKLWIMPPAKEADVPQNHTPRWDPFETVHISLNVPQALASLAAPATPNPTPPLSGKTGSPPAVGAVPQAPSPPAQSGSESELRVKIRELTDSNRALQERLDEQNRAMETMQQELQQLRKALSDSAKKPAKKQKSSSAP